MEGELKETVMLHTRADNLLLKDPRLPHRCLMENAYSQVLRALSHILSSIDVANWMDFIRDEMV